MRRAFAATLLLLLASALALAVGRLSPAPGTVYTVPEVVAGLAHHPSAWVGRTILVRGRVLEAEVWEPPRIWPRATPGTRPVVMPASTSGGSLVASPPMGCRTADYPCVSLLENGQPLPPGSSVHLSLFSTIPDTSVPLDKMRWPPGLTLRVQGPDPVLAMLRRVPVVARWAPPLRYVDWGHLVVSRITLLPRPARRCAIICDDGVMIDTVAQ